jgi:hypothetical protein
MFLLAFSAQDKACARRQAPHRFWASRQGIGR